MLLLPVPKQLNAESSNIVLMCWLRRRAAQGLKEAPSGVSTQWSVDTLQKLPLAQTDVRKHLPGCFGIVQQNGRPSTRNPTWLVSGVSIPLCSCGSASWITRKAVCFSHTSPAANEAPTELSPSSIAKVCSATLKPLAMACSCATDLSRVAKLADNLAK